jgi:hypothetical protein
MGVNPVWVEHRKVCHTCSEGRPCPEGLRILTSRTGGRS